MDNPLVDEKILIRPLKTTDLDAIVAIEQQAHEYPWKRNIHLSCIEEGYPSLVLELEGNLVAYIVFNYLFDECHLMNITTSLEHQGQGFAKRLMQSLYAASSEAGMKKVILEVRESNTPALGLYRKENFVDIGHRPDYYPSKSGRESAVVMHKLLE